MSGPPHRFQVTASGQSRHSGSAAEAHPTDRHWRPWHALHMLAILLPPALVVIAVGRYAVNVPYWDQWELVEPLRKLYAGQLSASDLWVQHNEHRILFPRVVMLALARASRWNIFYELSANVVFASLTFIFLWKLLRTTVHQISPTLSLMLAVPCSMLTFSLAQWQNWTWGWQVAIFMNALGSVVTVWSLSRWPADWRGPAVAFGGALLGTFSLINGLFLLGIVPLGVLLGRVPGAVRQDEHQPETHHQQRSQTVVVSDGVVQSSVYEESQRVAAHCQGGDDHRGYDGHQARDRNGQGLQTGGAGPA